MDWRERITVDTAVCHGKPCFKGTRVMVSVILQGLACGESAESLVRAFRLAPEDIEAALAYAAQEKHLPPDWRRLLKEEVDKKAMPSHGALQSNWRFYVLALVMIVGVAFGVVYWLDWQRMRRVGPWQQYAVSDSPDGKYRCIVKEREVGPAGVQYTAEIVDSAIGRPLAGDLVKFNNDSLSSGQIDFKWTDKGLDMRTEYSSKLLRCRFENGHQKWQVFWDTPTTRPTSMAASQPSP